MTEILLASANDPRMPPSTRVSESVPFLLRFGQPVSDPPRGPGSDSRSQHTRETRVMRETTDDA
jgi:hypothetical protein